MGAVPIVQSNSRVSVCSSNDNLPEFYMADFSVLGLLVASLDKAYQALAGRNFAISKKPDHLEVAIDRADQLVELVNLLIKSGIDCTSADIVDQVYQG